MAALTGCATALGPPPDDRFGPLANGEGWYDTMDACNSAELMDLAFANKLEI